SPAAWQSVRARAKSDGWPRRSRSRQARESPRPNSREPPVHSPGAGSGSTCPPPPAPRTSRTGSRKTVPAENFDVTLGLAPAAARGKVIALSKLVLQASHVRGLRPQVDARDLATQHVVDRGLGLEHRRRKPILGNLRLLLIPPLRLLAHHTALQLLSKQRSEQVRHLNDGVVAQHVDRDATRLRLPQRLRPPPVVILEGDHHVRVAQVTDDRCRRGHLVNRLLQAVAAHAKRENARGA